MRVTTCESAVGESAILKYTADKKASCKSAIRKLESFYQGLGETHFHELAILNSPALWLNRAFQRRRIIDFATDLPPFPHQANEGIFVDLQRLTRQPKEAVNGHGRIPPLRSREMLSPTIEAANRVQATWRRKWLSDVRNRQTETTSIAGSMARKRLRSRRAAHARGRPTIAPATRPGEGNRNCFHQSPSNSGVDR
jgi:hypothetical protein